VVGNKLIFDVEEEEAIDSAQLKAIITDKQYNLMYQDEVIRHFKKVKI